MRSGTVFAIVLSIGAGAVMYRPGAERSGLVKPSIVFPYADQLGSVSSLGSDVPFWSSAPTVITNGSLPGAYDIETGPPLPWLPAAATTTMPFSQSASTARSSGSNRMLVSVAPASEKLATRMLYSFACASTQSAAATTSLVLD